MIEQSHEELGWTPLKDYSDLEADLKEDKDIIHIDIQRKRLEELLVNDVVVKILRKKYEVEKNGGLFAGVLD